MHNIIVLVTGERGESLRSPPLNKSEPFKHSAQISANDPKRTYIITAKRMISGDVLKYRNGFFI